MKEKLTAQIQRYNPVNEQGETDKETLLDLLNRPEDISVRENLTGHLTASAWHGLIWTSLLKKAASRGLRNGSIQNW